MSIFNLTIRIKDYIPINLYRQYMCVAYRVFDPLLSVVFLWAAIGHHMDQSVDSAKRDTKLKRVDHMGV